MVKFRALNRRNVVLDAGIAQMVEQRTCNAKVPSSILGAGTTIPVELGVWRGG